MNPARDGKDTGRIAEEAAVWLLRLEKASPKETAAFREWLERSPEHVCGYLEAAAVDLTLEALTPEQWARLEIGEETSSESGIPSESGIAGESGVAGERRISSERVAVRASTPAPVVEGREGLGRASARRSWLLGACWAVAAGIALAAVGIGVLDIRRGETYASSVGEFRRVALSDGTAMELNTNTEVRVRFLEKERQVTLVRGEAFFGVAHDSARPFYVKVEDNTVRAVGTQFVVRLRQGHAVDVLVTEGRVEVNGSFGNSTAGAGTLTRVRGAHAEEEALSKPEVEKRLAWTKGWLIFAGETLAQAVAEFNRYSQRRLVVRDARVANLQIGGVFSVEHPDPDYFASALQSLGIEAHHVNQAGEDVILLQRGAP